MATITSTPGYTFIAGETVEANDLNLLGSPTIAISNIVDADIGSGAAIALSKLATGALPTAITTTTDNLVNNSVTAGKLSNSATVGTGVGYVRQTGSGGSPPSSFVVIQGPTGTRIAYAWGITGAASTSALTPVTFPVTFSSAPRVTATVVGILWGFTRIVSTTDVTTTSFNFQVRDQNGTAQANPIDWIAIGPVA
jgi:hypothetical protein